MKNFASVASPGACLKTPAPRRLRAGGPHETAETGALTGRAFQLALRHFSASLALAASLLAGCATQPDVDWNGRIGTFTYDNAIAELGPPDKQSKLADGKTVAVWINRRSSGRNLNTFPGIYGSHPAAGPSQSAGRGGSERVLRLTFEADGRLAACSKNY